jgi:hypothetical protein
LRRGTGEGAAWPEGAHGGREGGARRRGSGPRCMQGAACGWPQHAAERACMCCCWCGTQTALHWTPVPFMTPGRPAGCLPDCLLACRAGWLPWSKRRLQTRRSASSCSSTCTCVPAAQPPAPPAMPGCWCSSGCLQQGSHLSPAPPCSHAPSSA